MNRDASYDSLTDLVLGEVNSQAQKGECADFSRMVAKTIDDSPAIKLFKADSSEWGDKTEESCRTPTNNNEDRKSFISQSNRSIVPLKFKKNAS